MFYGGIIVGLLKRLGYFPGGTAIVLTNSMKYPPNGTATIHAVRFFRAVPVYLPRYSEEMTAVRWISLSPGKKEVC